VNIKDVAKMAGVSISTISRVINNSAFVSPDVKERIEKVLAETGYRPNSLAKELLRNKTDTIGVILPRIDLGTFAAIFDGISAVLSKNGYNMLLANTRDELDEELRYLNLFYEKRVDGILYFATGITAQHRAAVTKLHMPVVIVGQSGEYLECPSVRLDSFEAARTMVGHLIALGHRRIGCLAVPDYDVNVGTLRKEGYLAALKENGIPFDPSLVVTGDFEYLSGELGAEELMKHREEKPTAIYCITDRLAVSASGWLLRNGYRVPEDVSVACIDDPALLSFCYPSITTMSFDYQRTGTLAAQMIVDCINGKTPDPFEVVMPFTLKSRGSTHERQ
jgi:DNA-binding LacI/PurR family transcriptional regulator